MSKISIRSRAGEFKGDLDGSDISNAIWLSPPLTLETNMLGGMMYCDLPLDVILPKEGRVTELETGDIAYWPGPGAFCVFFGPTPLSREDGRPVAPYPVIRIGRMIGDCSRMDDIGDRQRIILEPRLRGCKVAAPGSGPLIGTGFSSPRAPFPRSSSWGRL
ncbi:MAG: AfsR family transcriptional regulator [Candidatus Methanomethylophilaceae archaeon]|nr:AfsR family transcriptional regulator [Candidatus Methanomethylophilaceae archaeon]